MGYDMDSEIRITEKKKLKIIIIITFVLTLLFSSMDIAEYLNDRRINRAEKYRVEAGIIAMLSDLLRADLECIDKRGKVHDVYTDNDKSYAVERDISDYIYGQSKILYRYKIVEDENTQKFIDFFNDNMKHLRVCKRDKNGKLTSPQTISEAEGLEEFKEVNNLDELIKYMYKTTEDGKYYLYVLKYMDYDDPEFNGKIIYEREDGTEKTLFEDRAISIWDLFTNRDYLYVAVKVVK